MSAPVGGASETNDTRARARVYGAQVPGALFTRSAGPHGGKPGPAAATNTRAAFFLRVFGLRAAVTKGRASEGRQQRLMRLDAFLDEQAVGAKLTGALEAVEGLIDKGVAFAGEKIKQMT